MITSLSRRIPRPPPIRTSDDCDVYEPTQAEIAAACERIRSQWSPHELNQRLAPAYRPKAPATPFVRPTDLDSSTEHNPR